MLIDCGNLKRVRNTEYGGLRNSEEDLYGVVLAEYWDL